MPTSSFSTPLTSIYKVANEHGGIQTTEEATEIGRMH